MRSRSGRTADGVCEWPFLLELRRSGRIEGSERRRSLERVGEVGVARLRRAARYPLTSQKARNRNSGWW